ncbi:methyltransferase [Limibacter armeniacum]|uniref:class I SAM-dependent methyltransferase n=1 Tax=Limibacter armeniacum TaxID=466084 RepID=UPI002FE55735
MKFPYEGKTYSIIRYPETSNRSLRAWSAADELMVNYIAEEKLTPTSPVTFNDRFGFLGSLLEKFQPVSVINYCSQQKAIQQNFTANKVSVTGKSFANPLEKLPSTDLGLINVPKSMDLFRLFLYQLSQSLTGNGTVLCGFMTRHFTPQMLKIAEAYFEEVGQSRAVKKARLLILRKPKNFEENNILNEVRLDEHTVLKQYFGVFSANNIDYATQFFIEHLEVKESDQKILDLASGNGVLALAARRQQPASEIHLMDDSWLAVESSKLNLPEENTYFHFNNSMDELEKGSYDLVISNPPFHFEHENNIEVSLTLFEEVAQRLKKGGRFELVANRHLNYKVHLEKLFGRVETVAENEKFVIYRCTKI